MIRLTPRLLISTATAFVGLGAQPTVQTALGMKAGQSAGPAYNAELPRSWDVPLIQHCGYWAHYDHRSEQSAWPLPARASAMELGRLAAERGVLREDAEAGDIFLQYGPRRKEFVHAGIVIAVTGKGRLSATEPYVDLKTVEGDTDELGQPFGGAARYVNRRVWPGAGDRFLRWAELEDYERNAARASFIYKKSAGRRG